MIAFSPALLKPLINVNKDLYNWELLLFLIFSSTWTWMEENLQMGMAGAESPAPWRSVIDGESQTPFLSWPKDRTRVLRASRCDALESDHLKPAHSHTFLESPGNKWQSILTVLCLSYKGAQSLPLLSWVSWAPIYGSVGVHVPVCEPVYAER